MNSGIGSVRWVSFEQRDSLAELPPPVVSERAAAKSTSASERSATFMVPITYKFSGTYTFPPRDLELGSSIVVVATVISFVVGLTLMQLIKRFAPDASKFEIEQLFSNARLMAAALAAAISLVVASSRIHRREGPLTYGSAAIIGAVQGLCLPYRGFSRSGATISTGLVCGVARARGADRWHLFGGYCLVAAAFVYWLNR